MYGPGDRALLPLFVLASRGVLPHVGRASAAYTFVYVTDLVRAIAAAVDRGASGDVLFVGHAEAGHHACAARGRAQRRSDAAR